jgi:hypothetical protein
LGSGLAVCGFVANAEGYRHVTTQCVHGGIKRMIVNGRHVAFTWSMFFVIVRFLAAPCDTYENEISFMMQIIWAWLCRVTDNM